MKDSIKLVTKSGNLLVYLTNVYVSKNIAHLLQPTVRDAIGKAGGQPIFVNCPLPLSTPTVNSFFVSPNNSIRQPVNPAADPREGSRAERNSVGERESKADWPVNLVVTSTRLPAGMRM